MGQAQGGYASFLREAGKVLNDGLMITDSQNRIIHINRKAQDALALNDTEYEGKHLLDIIPDAEFLSLVKKSMDDPGQVMSGEYKGRTMRLISLNKAGELTPGTIIAFISRS